MAGVRTTLTEAQIEARRNHYLEKVGRGKPKAKGTKNNPLKNKDLSKMLKERFNKKPNNNNTQASPKANDAIAELNKQQQNKPLTNAEAHQIQNNVSDKSLEALKKAKANLEAEEHAATQTQTKAAAPAPKKSAEPKTWKQYMNDRGVNYEQPKSGMAEVEKRAADYAKRPRTWKQYLNDRGFEYNQPKSGLGEVEKRSADYAKRPRTWKQYLNDRGFEYNQPKSGIGAAEQKAADVISKNELLRKEALENAGGIKKPFTTSAEQIDNRLNIGKNHYNVPSNYSEEYANLLNRKEALENAGGIKKPFTTSAAKIDRQLDIGKTHYPVSSGYADDYAKLMDEKYGKIGGSGIDPIPPEPKNPKVKTGFFSKIGKFFKSKKGKLALAGLLVTVIGAGIAYFASKNKKSKQTNDTQALAQDTTAAGTAPAAPEQGNEQQKVNKYCIDMEEGKMPKSYTFKEGDYPSAIITEAYGVKYGTPEYNAIRDAVYEASEYEKNTNLKVGDKFTLPDVKVGDKTYSANEKAEAVSGQVIDNGLKTSRTKEVVKEGDKFYIVFCETGERVSDEPSFNNMEEAQKRILELENAEE